VARNVLGLSLPTLLQAHAHNVGSGRDLSTPRACPRRLVYAGVTESILYLDALRIDEFDAVIFSQSNDNTPIVFSPALINNARQCSNISIG
jgi:hypothetical protein